MAICTLFIEKPWIWVNQAVLMSFDELPTKTAISGILSAFQPNDRFEPIRQLKQAIFSLNTTGYTRNRKIQIVSWTAWRFSLTLQTWAIHAL